MSTAKITTKGWVVIPKPLREKYGLLPGTRVQFVDYGGSLSIMVVPDDVVESGFGLLQPDGATPLTRTLQDERARDRRREDPDG